MGALVVVGVFEEGGSLGGGGALLGYFVACLPHHKLLRFPVHAGPWADEDLVIWKGRRS